MNAMKPRDVLALALLGMGLSSLPTYGQDGKYSAPGQGATLSGNWSDWNLLNSRPGKSYGDGRDKLRTAFRNYMGLNGDLPSRVVHYRVGTSEAFPQAQYASNPTQTYTEGFGYAMMFAAQMGDGSGSQDDKDAHKLFDDLFRFVYNNLMYYKGKAPNYWYSVWQINVDVNNGNLTWTGGTHNDAEKSPNDGPAPDGEAWMATALFIAAGKWGGTDANGNPAAYAGPNGATYDYKGMANQMLQTYLHTEEWRVRDGVTQNYGLFSNMFDTNHRESDIPASSESKIISLYCSGGQLPDGVNAWITSDPSYNLPAFFQYWAKYADQDNTTWAAVASAARKLLSDSVGVTSNVNGNQNTGLAPDYSTQDGKAYASPYNRGFGLYYSADAHRVAATNITADWMWWGDPNNSAEFGWQKGWANTFLNGTWNRSTKTFAVGSGRQAYGRLVYPVYLYPNGTPLDTANPGDHNEGVAAQNAVAAAIADNSDHAWLFVDELADETQPAWDVTWGSPYWDGSLYLIGLMEATGNFRPTPPTGGSGGTPSGGGSSAFSGTYYLTPRSAPGQCLDVNGYGTSDGNPVDIYAYNSQTNQQWNITSVGGSLYRLSPVSAPSRCLDAVGYGLSDGNSVDVWTYNSQTNQQWSINSTGDGYYYLEPASAPSRALDVSNWGTANGTGIDVYTYNSQQNQQWQITAVGTPSNLTAN